MSNIQTGAERMPHDLSHLGFLAGQIGRLITISTTPVIAGDSFEMDAVFFFSSRRRHTRLTCDSSSDVCSSDLASELPGEINAEAERQKRERCAQDLRFCNAIHAVDGLEAGVIDVADILDRQRQADYKCKQGHQGTAMQDQRYRQYDQHADGYGEETKANVFSEFVSFAYVGSNHRPDLQTCEAYDGHGDGHAQRILPHDDGRRELRQCHQCSPLTG